MGRILSRTTPFLSCIALPPIIYAMSYVSFLIVETYVFLCGIPPGRGRILKPQHEIPVLLLQWQSRWVAGFVESPRLVLPQYDLLLNACAYGDSIFVCSYPASRAVEIDPEGRAKKSKAGGDGVNGCTPPLPRLRSLCGSSRWLIRGRMVS